MKITFVLPGAACNPVGGFKVVYEYANGLAQRGHDVVVVQPAVVQKAGSAFWLLAKTARYLQRSLDGSYHPRAWFRLDRAVKVKWVYSLSERWIPEGDVIIATAWQTAEWIRTYGRSKGRQFYLIHDYEYFQVADSETRRRMALTYNAGMHNIVTSPAGIEMLSICNASYASYIPNAIDFKVMGLKVGIESESRISIGFPSRPERFKGTQDAVAALTTLHARLGNALDVWSFGGAKPVYLPEWINYHRRPSDEVLCQLYNHAMIFVVPSLYEGWGLPGAEAMACGAALISTDNGGVRAYATDSQTALLSPSGDIDALAANINRLIQDRDLRLRLAQAGFEHIQEFTWKRALDSLEACLIED
ncbi:hypothetical protein BI364_12410 [Acidihalobacter yilgarnensis]|uniref:Glycosyl transferase family 1 domain-containing protein n=1 Tax=Acidihalobacter yilgarnensis TaxID=2819280 RepID=A0A1D8IQI1_9GAMM|nr:glycosyltransferase family 4 protein [Acidihalobacter yilgarnensis]AOU98654.1 hypothetical protein BI364_12410 [Acidihalobacter yilgarnensis]